MDSREQFEQWAKGYSLIAKGLHRFTEHSAYADALTHSAWLAWQASREALEDKARSQHARDSVELRDLCSQRDGLKAELWRVKEERDSQQRIAIAAMAELAELKAKLEGWQLVPVEPTLSMHIAADREDDKAFIGGSYHGATNADIWYAMLAAAPSKEGL